MEENVPWSLSVGVSEHWLEAITFWRPPRIKHQTEDLDMDVVTIKFMFAPRRQWHAGFGGSALFPVLLSLPGVSWEGQFIHQ